MPIIIYHNAKKPKDLTRDTYLEMEELDPVTEGNNNEWRDDEHSQAKGNEAENKEHGGNIHSDDDSRSECGSDSSADEAENPG